MAKSLEHKTIRPGSLNNYSFYYSNQQPDSINNDTAAKPKKFNKILGLFLLISAAAFVGFHQSNTSNSPAAAPQKNNVVAGPKTSAKSATPAAVVNNCAGNTLDKFISISVGQRKLWACSGTKEVYASSVITGIEKYPATETPLGTYKIYSKTQDTVLTGSDATGSWRDPVSYWMPFLDNQYGTYGFHDATWRNPSEFGNIDPATADNASHGCVELPLATSKWLYNWSVVGTTLTIKA